MDAVTLALAQSYSDKSIEDKLYTVYKYQGSVATKDDLPSNPKNGDVYNILEDGSNCAWSERENMWDEFAPRIGGGSSKHFPVYELEDLGEIKFTIPSGSSSYNKSYTGSGSNADVTRESGWVEILKGVECKISVRTWTTSSTEGSGATSKTTVYGNITVTATIRQTKIDGYIPKGINLKQTSSIQVAGKTITFGDTNNLITENITPFSTFPITLFTKTSNPTWTIGTTTLMGNVSGTLTIPEQSVPFNVKWF